MVFFTSIFTDENSLKFYSLSCEVWVALKDEHFTKYLEGLLFIWCLESLNNTEMSTNFKFCINLTCVF